jgi:choline kinase
MVDHAVILAAGQNRRMAASLQPKALLPLGKGTFLSRHIELLMQHGAARILVVVNEQSARSFLPYEDSQVKIVVSPFSRATVGSSLSLLCGLDSVLKISGAASCLALDADIVYERALAKEVIGASNGRSQLYSIQSISGDSEEVRVYSQGTSPVLIGKGLPSNLTEGLLHLGESLGMIYLNAYDLRYCRDLIRWIAGCPPEVKGFGYSGALSEHEEVWQYLFNLGRLAVQSLDGDLLFAECDTAEDYQHIRETVFPAIEKQDSRTQTNFLS